MRPLIYARVYSTVAKTKPLVLGSKDSKSAQDEIEKNKNHSYSM